VRVTSALAVIALLYPAAARAQEPGRQPLQELFLTETVYPQERGELQVTLGALVDRTRDDKAALVPFSLEYGITDRWQLEGGWDGHTQFHSAPFKHLHTARFSVGTKYSLMNIHDSHVHAAIGIDTEFPKPGAFAEGEGEEGIELEPFVAAAADLSRHLTLFGSFAASVEASHAESDGEAQRVDDRGTISGGALVPMGHATVALEYTTRSDQLPWRLDGAALLTPSITVHGARWEFAFATPIGIRASANRPGLGFHLIREF
jgi:hypothetical protein